MSFVYIYIYITYICIYIYIYIYIYVYTRSTVRLLLFRRQHHLPMYNNLQTPDQHTHVYIYINMCQSICPTATPPLPTQTHTMTRHFIRLQHTATHRNATGTPPSPIQAHTRNKTLAPHCNKLQHTATHCYTLHGPLYYH